jgi:hypothetical protein
MGECRGNLGVAANLAHLTLVFEAIDAAVARANVAVGQRCDGCCHTPA